MPTFSPHGRRVLVVLEKQQPLIELATAFWEGRPSRTDIRSLQLPTEIEIDPSYVAVPLGSADPAAVSVHAMHPAVSETFCVRGYIKAADVTQVPENIGGARVFSDPVIEPLLTCRGAPPVGSTTDVQTKLNAPQLWANALDGTNVAIAIVDMGINLAFLTMKLGTTPQLDPANSFTRPGVSSLPGEHPVKHGTRCAYDALIAAPKATLLDYRILNPGEEAPLSSTLSEALLAYARLAKLFQTGVVGSESAARFKSLVVSNSWGVWHPDDDFAVGHSGRYVDNPDHPFHRSVTTLVAAGGDVVFAAGNCGAGCPPGTLNEKCKNRTTETIMGASAYPEVLTLAGCDINDDRAGYSSQGPAIANMFQQKPDLTAYTHFLGAEVQPGKPDDGTSAASPVAAGCVAALRTKIPSAQVSPAELFQQLRASARQIAGPAGWNKDYGFGIIDPIRAARGLAIPIA